MSTTSLKLSEDLKERAAKAAQELGISSHAFMVDAIRQAADNVELRSRFVAQAQAAQIAMMHSGGGYDANEVRNYLKQRLIDKSAIRPETKSWQE